MLIFLPSLNLISFVGMAPTPGEVELDLPPPHNGVLKFPLVSNSRVRKLKI